MNYINSAPSNKTFPKGKTKFNFSDWVKTTIMKRSTIAPLDSMVKVQGGKMYITDLENYLALPTNLPDSMYKFFNNTFEPSEIPPEDFPNNPELSDCTGWFALPLQDLYFALQCVSNDPAQIVLNGLKISKWDEGIEIAACDGSILFKKRYISPYALNIDVILSNGTLVFLEKIRGMYSSVEIKIYNELIKIETPEFTFISKLIEGKYPDYQRVWPKDAQFRTTFNRADLQGALEAIKPYIAKEKHTFSGGWNSPSVSFFEEGYISPTTCIENMNKGVKLNWNTMSHKRTKGEIVLMPVKGKDDSWFSFDVDYLLDCCKYIQEDTISFIWNDKNSAFVITY